MRLTFLLSKVLWLTLTEEKSGWLHRQCLQLSHSPSPLQFAGGMGRSWTLEGQFGLGRSFLPCCCFCESEKSTRGIGDWCSLYSFSSLGWRKLSELFFKYRFYLVRHKGYFSSFAFWNPTRFFYLNCKKTTNNSNVLFKQISKETFLHYLWQLFCQALTYFLPKSARDWQNGDGSGCLKEVRHVLNPPSAKCGFQYLSLRSFLRKRPRRQMWNMLRANSFQKLKILSILTLTLHGPPH